MAPAAQQASFLQDAGTWKFAAGVVIGYCVRVVTSRLHLQAAPKKAAPKKKLAVPRPTEELKMVLCVNNSLNMGKGKIGAQCAHAATGVVQSYQSKMAVPFRQWEMMGQAKIALKCNTSEELEQLEAQALQAGLPCYLVHDAGRTQIPAGSQTVLAIGPAPKSKINEITGHLKLL